jgi:radical SAM protein with 4Fe4S-binding SPASM domain
MPNSRLAQLQYTHRLVAGFRRANRRYSPERDMAACPFPQWIQLQTINACNAACVMCPYTAYKGAFPRGRMDDELFDRVVDEIAGRPEVETFIPMLQNEPFLDRRILDRVAEVKRRTAGRVVVELVTNGAFLTEETVGRIRESGLDVLDVSLDAVSREVYRKVRVGLDYDRVMAGVERLLSADLGRTAVFLRLVRVKDNWREARAFARHWRRRGVPVFVYTAHNRAGAVADFDEASRLPDAEIGWLDRLGRRAFRQYMGHCPIPFAMANVLHDGDVLMCVHDWARKEIVGNVREATLAEIWNGERMREVRRLVSERRYAELPACRDCSLWKDGWY